MPLFTALSWDEIAALARGGTKRGVDLRPYLAAVSAAAAGGWGRVVLEPGDNRRAVKRRVTAAGQRLGYAVRWSKRAAHGELLYQGVRASPKDRGARSDP